jgi:hypothetical protein
VKKTHKSNQNIAYLPFAAVLTLVALDSIDALAILSIAGRTLTIGIIIKKILESQPWKDAEIHHWI